MPMDDQRDIGRNDTEKKDRNIWHMEVDDVWPLFLKLLI